METKDRRLEESRWNYFIYALDQTYRQLNLKKRTESKGEQPE